MENGKIAEKETHQELVNQGGAYKKLWDEYQKAANWKIGGGNEMSESLRHSGAECAVSAGSRTS